MSIPGVMSLAVHAFMVFSLFGTETVEPEPQVNGNLSRSEDESAHEEEVEKKEAAGGEVEEEEEEEKGEESEEDKIQELMNRSDTAVIFPEPVSDPEDNLANGDDAHEGRTPSYCKKIEQRIKIKN